MIEDNLMGIAVDRHGDVVTACNTDGVWNPEALSIDLLIMPAPWLTWWAKALYGLAASALLYVFYWFQLRRNLAKAESHRLLELDAAKTRLYTNITHEFRTPLTIILGMADRVEQDPRQWLREGTAMIRRNGQSLLRLVNQMLDLARLEAGTLTMKMVQADIIAYLGTLFELFHSFAESQQIRTRFEAGQEILLRDFDPEKIKDIASNLIINAIKFTPQGGLVAVYAGREEDGRFLLRVSDTGPGIAPEQLPHIFDRFYQADDSATRRDEGTGIGLSLVRELVKLLGGEIAVQSQVGEGEVFSIWLPVSKEAPLAGLLPEPDAMLVGKTAGEAVPAAWHPDSLPLALIVEDNADVRTYLASCLQGRYRVEMARHGRQGMYKAFETVPDVIVSHVMMPEMDGFELCRILKEDRRTSHIPIVLLTARADLEARLEGLERGADAYLAKPFDERELEVSLRKMMELRQSLRERYGQSGPMLGEESPAYSREDAFVAELHELLEQELDNNELDVPDLAKKMAMSERQLRRKMTALLDATPRAYLRRFRLKRAYAMLRRGGCSVGEVAAEVGFKDAARFSNAFFAEYGLRPSDVQ